MPLDVTGPARRSPALAIAAAIVAAVLVAWTLVHFGVGANGIAWSVVQIVLVFIAWFDLLTRRIPNVVVVPAAIAAIVLRIAFDRDGLLECVLAGAIAFAVFLVLALLVRGGLGMGDVKLAALIGVLLGRDAATALILGAFLGGVAGLVLIVRGASRRTSLAYGPYLAAGAVVVILMATPPALTH
jgi:leader peptidase (prepilin peptidase)/N-methyltransferase